MTRRAPILLCLVGCSDAELTHSHADDACQGQDVAGWSIDALEIGSGPDGESFAPWVDGAPVPLVLGPQGGEMFDVRLRVVGEVPNDCLVQATSVRDPGGTPVGFAVGSAVNAYDQGDGSLLTNSFWVVLDGTVAGSELAVVVEATAYETTVTRQVVLQPPPP